MLLASLESLKGKSPEGLKGWENSCYSSFADPSKRRTGDSTHPPAFVMVSLPYNAHKTKVDQMCCIHLPRSERAGFLSSRAFRKPQKEVGVFSEPLQEWWGSVDTGLSQEVFSQSQHMTVVTLLSSKDNEVGSVCKLRVHAYMMHTVGNTSMAIHSQLGLEASRHPSMLLVIHKAKQLILSFPVHFDT